MQTYIQDFAQAVGKVVTIKGWAANKRESKMNIFIVFRDGTGYTQAVVNKEVVGEEQFNAAKSLTQESSVILTGLSPKMIDK